MQTRHQFAILAAGLLVGTQIGVAAIGVPIPDTDQQMEPVAPEAVVLESESESATQGVPGEPSSAADAGTITAPGAIVEAVIPAAVPQPAATYSSPFPPSTDDVPLLPAVIAYLERTAHLRITGASGEIFPPSTDDKPLLPVVIAYFEKLEATRLAARAQQVARLEHSSSPADNAATRQPAIAVPAGQTSVQDIAALDSRSPQSVGTSF